MHAASVYWLPDSPTTACVKQDGIEMHAASVLLDMPAKTDIDLTGIPFFAKFGDVGWLMSRHWSHRSRQHYASVHHSS
jgi:hypothetical protein